MGVDLKSQASKSQNSSLKADQKSYKVSNQSSEKKSSDFKKMAGEKLLMNDELLDEDSSDANNYDQFIKDCEISVLSDFTKDSCCLRWFIGLTVFLYVAVLTAAIVYQ